MPLEFDDNEIQELESDARFEQLTTLLLGYINAVKTGENEERIAQALKFNSEKIAEVVEAVGRIEPKITVQPAKVELRQDRLEATISSLLVSNKLLLAAIKELNETNKKPREFKITYGPMQRIESIVASIKS